VTVELMPAGKQNEDGGDIISGDERGQDEEGQRLYLCGAIIGGVSEAVDYYGQADVEEVSAEGALNKGAH